MTDSGPKRLQWITLVQQVTLKRSSSVSQLVHTSSPFSSVRTVQVNLLGAHADRTLYQEAVAANRSQGAQRLFSLANRIKKYLMTSSCSLVATDVKGDCCACDKGRWRNIFKRRLIQLISIVNRSVLDSCREIREREIVEKNKYVFSHYCSLLFIKK